MGGAVDDEADGLRALAAALDATGADDLAVAEVVVADPGLLVTRWVAPGRRTADGEEALGRGLAGLHSAPGPGWGGGSSWIGACRVDPAPASDVAGFYGRRLRELAHRGGLGTPVDRLVGSGRFIDLLAPVAGSPSWLHGDLWWGNVLWGADGRPWLIDPSVHGGCAEEDLAMLGLFGPVPGRTLAAYRELRPPVDGWEARVDLFTLVPLLVHTVLFGGGYRSRAEEVLDRLLPRAAGAARGHDGEGTRS